MSKPRSEPSFWSPINDAVVQAREQAKDLNRHAKKLARRTAEELRSRSETVLTAAQERSEAVITAAQKRSEAVLNAAQKRSESTLEVVQRNVASAQKAFEERGDQLARLLDAVRRQLRPIETRLRKGTEQLARGLNLAVESDVDALRRRVHTLEKRLGELTQESKAA